MSAVKDLIFGNNAAADAARSAREQAAVAATRQQAQAQDEQARVDTQAGKVVNVPRGRRLLLDGQAGGSNLAATVG